MAKTPSRFPQQKLINEVDKKYFLDIFNLNARVDPISNQKKINFEGLIKLFEMVGFQPNEKQKAEFQRMFDGQKNKEMTFDNFLKIF